MDWMGLSRLLVLASTLLSGLTALIRASRQVIATVRGKRSCETDGIEETGPESECDRPSPPSIPPQDSSGGPQQGR